MYSLYKVKTLPVQVRRFIIFRRICRKAKKYSDNFVTLMPDTKLAFSVYYSERSKNM